MAFRIITADERLSAAENKTSLAIFGPPGVGKTTLLNNVLNNRAGRSGGCFCRSPVPRPRCRARWSAGPVFLRPRRCPGDGTG